MSPATTKPSALRGAFVQVNAKLLFPIVGGEFVDIPIRPVHPGVPVPNGATPGAFGSAFIKNDAKLTPAAGPLVTQISIRPSESKSLTPTSESCTSGAVQ